MSITPLHKRPTREQIQIFRFVKYYGSPEAMAHFDTAKKQQRNLWLREAFKNWQGQRGKLTAEYKRLVSDLVQSGAATFAMAHRRDQSVLSAFGIASIGSFADHQAGTAKVALPLLWREYPTVYQHAHPALQERIDNFETSARIYRKTYRGISSVFSSSF